MTAVLGADTGSLSLREADAAAHAVVAELARRDGLEGAVVATHLTRLGPVPHLTLSVDAPAVQDIAGVLLTALPGAQVAPAGDAGAAGVGAAAHAGRSGGRAVHFPGVDRLTGTLTVGGVLDRSAVEHVRVLGGRPTPDPEVPLVTRDHVRPLYEGGLLVLATEWAVGPALVPFECPDPTPCCADHAG